MRASPADYKSALRPGFAAGRGLFAQRSSAGALTFYTATETVARPGTELAVNYWFSLIMCFWGDAHAGVSCRLQVGAPLKSELRFI